MGKLLVLLALVFLFKGSNSLHIDGRNESLPISAAYLDPKIQAIIQANQDLIYVGSCHEKAVFYSHHDKTQETARAYCKKRGLNLMKIDFQKEADFISDNLPEDVKDCWTDGRNKRGLRYFLWDTNGEPVSDSLKLGSPSSDLGLTLYGGTLIPTHPTHYHCSLCYTPVTGVPPGSDCARISSNSN